MHSLVPSRSAIGISTACSLSVVDFSIVISVPSLGLESRSCTGSGIEELSALNITNKTISWIHEGLSWFLEELDERQHLGKTCG